MAMVGTGEMETIGGVLLTVLGWMLSLGDEDAAVGGHGEALAEEEEGQPAAPCLTTASFNMFFRRVVLDVEAEPEAGCPGKTVWPGRGGGPWGCLSSVSKTENRFMVGSMDEGERGRGLPRPRPNVFHGHGVELAKWVAGTGQLEEY